MTSIEPVKPNVHAWRFVLPLGLAAYVAFLVYLLPSNAGSNAYQAGRAVLPALLPALVVGIVAKQSATPWRWWWYPGAVLLPAFLWFGMLEVVPDVAEDRVADGTEGRSLATPDVVGDWRLIDSPAAQRRGEARLDRIESVGADGVYGEYAGAEGGMFYFGATVPSSSQGLYEELQDSPTDALNNFLAGAGLNERDPVEPGPLGGAMVCGAPDQPNLQPGTFVCGWADLSTVASVTVVGRDLDRDRAAEMVRAFRAEVTVKP